MLRQRNCCFLGIFLGLGLVPLCLWAVRAPDPAYAPLPDYDIRWGYLGGTSLRQAGPEATEEAALLREQRGAKGLPSRQRNLRAGDTAAVLAAFGAEVKVQWSPTGTPRTLRRESGPLTAPQPGADPQAVAREFLRSHPTVFGLSDAGVDALLVARQINSPRARHITFRQTVDGVPIYGADYKVSLTADNAVLLVGGRLYPDLLVAGEASLTPIEATQAAASYVGPLTGKPSLHWGKAEPTVLRAEEGAENRTFLRREPFRGEGLARRVVFPLTSTLGRPAWRVYLMKRPMEYYEVVVDAEDGALLARTNQVKFIAWNPQGQVFLTNPGAAGQVTQSFVGDATASPNTFVDSTQSATQGNNAFPMLGGNDQTGAGNFSFGFTNSYFNSGATNFNLDTNKTIQFTPNGSGGYDMTIVTPADAVLMGAPITFFDSLGVNNDDGSNCNPSGGWAVPSGFTFFGVSVSSLCANSNGNLTVEGGDPYWSTEDVERMLQGLGRIMGLWDDLDPSAGGSVTWTNPAPGQLCFRWNSVPEFGASNSNTFSICVYGNGASQPAGTIRLSYPSAGVAATDGLVGITPSRPLFLSSTPDSQKTTVFTTFTNPESTLGPIGFARQFPSHNDVAAGATNIFWHLNQNGHDRLYPVGFAETAGNMQNNNFGRGGLDNDPIMILYSGSTNDPGGTNNAFFATSPEGSCCPYTNFLLFTSPPFRRVDSAFDSDVIVHEHGHGVSTRLVGSLDGPQAGALGEGWSDWLALSYSGDPVIGEYLTGNTSTGIRGVRYDNTSTREFGQYANIFGPITSFCIDFSGGIVICYAPKNAVFFPEVHDDGEIWASALADVRTALLGSGLGNDDVHELILDALALTPPDPTILEARDALATAATNAGLDVCTVWAPMAARGFGNSADYNNTGGGAFPELSLSVFPSRDRPNACGGSFSDAAAPIHAANFDTASVSAKKADGWQVPKKPGTKKRPGLWHVSSRRSTTGSNSFYFGTESNGTYETIKNGVGKRSTGMLISPKLDLSAATHPVLEMDIFIDVEELFPFDTLWVQLSTNGGVTYPIQRAILPWSTNGVFERIRIDLKPLAGKNNVRIQLYFDSLDPFVNSFEGVYIDSIAIRNYTEN